MKSFVRFIKSVKRYIIQMALKVYYNCSMCEYKILLHLDKIDLHIYKMMMIYITTDYCMKCIHHSLMNLKEANDFLDKVYEKLKKKLNK